MTPSNPDPDRRSASDMPDNDGTGTTKQKTDGDGRDVKREAGAKAHEEAEAGQHRMAAEADSLSDAIDAAASKLDDQDREGLARYARELSSHLADAAGQLEGRSVDELATEAKRLARNNPSQFMLGSIAIGFGLSRFFKASAERDHHADDSAYRKDSAGRDDELSTGTPMHSSERSVRDTNRTSTGQGNGHGRDML